MEERHAVHAGSYLLVALILSSIYTCIEAQSISGFLSIDCGGAPYVDDVTTLTWDGDSKFTSTGLSGVVPGTVDSNYDNYQALITFRYFPDGRSKHCYDLPTSGNVAFLLRAMFLQGRSSELTLPIEFDVAVNGTTWFTVQYGVDDSFDTLNTPIQFEGIFFAAGKLTHFCLVTRTGTPFISSLELRELNPDGSMYPNSTVELTTVQTRYLYKLQRFNCGAKFGSASVRYPDDTYDRIWETPGSWASNLNLLSNASTSAVNTFSDVNKVPSKVMGDAWLYDEPNTSFWVGFSNFSSQIKEVYAVVYYEEIFSGVPDGSRVFSIGLYGYTNNLTAYSDYTFGLYYSRLEIQQTALNMTFKALPESPLGPILNAFELYGHLLFNDSATAAKDVDALTTLQGSFNLTDWQGDPCYPVPWNWVGCTSDTPARVDELMLSSMNIHGQIPQIISDLDALTQIHLANNSLSGTIPDSLADLPKLAFLFLNDNNLSGKVPPALISKLGKDFDYSGNSLLGTNSTPPTPSTSSKKSSNIGVIIGAVAGVVVLGVVFGVLLWYFCVKKKKQNNPNKGEIAITERQTSSGQKPSDFETSLSKPPLGLQSAEVGRVPYKTVEIVTNNFSVKVGQGSYGSVYHGWLDGREVAVKINNVQSIQGRHEFITEVDILTRVHHRNLVSLIAYCDEEKELILIYEYQANGTLREWLHDKEKVRGTLDWKRRLQIAMDAAKGLEYLHKGCDPAIIHRDVKSNNILLDDNMAAKVADFGLSKSTPNDNSTGYSTGVKGTPGYLDPEYHQIGRLTYKSDVYSFGVVLAEIITGLPPFSLHSTGQSPVILVDRDLNCGNLKDIEFSSEANRAHDSSDFIFLMEDTNSRFDAQKGRYELVERNDIEALADPSLDGRYNPESMWRMADVTLSCIEPIGTMRPDFTQVVSSITDAAELEKTFTVHSPLASSRSFILRSNISHGYLNLP